MPIPCFIWQQGYFNSQALFISNKLLHVALYLLSSSKALGVVIRNVLLFH